MTKVLPTPLLISGIMLAALLSFLVFAGMASAHEAVNFNPADPNCMGKLTAFHAMDDGGIKKSAEMWPHGGIANMLGLDPADGSVQSFQKLSKAWCKSE